MARITVNTGGDKEFGATNPKGHTSSSQAFVNAWKEWSKKVGKKKPHHKTQRNTHTSNSHTKKTKFKRRIKLYVPRHFFLIYVIAHSIAFLLFNEFRSIYPEYTLWGTYIVGGFIVMSTGKLFQLLFHWGKLRINWGFIKWGLYHSLILYATTFTIPFLPEIPSQYIFIVAGSLITIYARLFKEALDSGILEGLISTAIVCLVLFLFFFGLGSIDFDNYDFIGSEFLQDVFSQTDIDADLEAFDYINEIREQNGRRAIKFDSRAYDLALNRSWDVHTRGYFDHVTPEGECAYTMKSAYGFSGSEDVAENLAGGSLPIAAVDGWMDSRGHRYNLLYGSHTGGAIACYGRTCTFLGVNRDSFGRGCTTGEQGLSFWREVSRQPGEI